MPLTQHRLDEKAMKHPMKLIPQMDIVAIKDGHVVAMAYSDAGKGDRAFAKKFLGPEYHVELMPLSEACERHSEYLKAISNPHPVRMEE